ncbi:hypothetical protein DPMN_157304 [Dreissena polymorpha]|uniref:Uncharacterized protein n=1 Tax=Dreissena polymorpha TaxID=45954 RepID=A0A9D4EJ38_DREPO|nr:hypothetical protein DPMN_157304 [Dreissena polymorpha]
MPDHLADAIRSLPGDNTGHSMTGKSPGTGPVTSPWHWLPVCGTGQRGPVRSVAPVTGDRSGRRSTICGTGDQSGHRSIVPNTGHWGPVTGDRSLGTGHWGPVTGS